MTATAELVYLDLKRLHPAQQHIERTARKFNVADCGRRFGKNEFLVQRVIEGSPQRRNGALDGYSWGWFAPTYKILDDSWRLLVDLLSGVPGIYINSSKYFIRTPLGGVVECWSFEAGEDVGRSREYDGGIVIDEAAMVPGLLRIHDKALSPLTVKFPDAEEWFASTPKGQGNDFYTLYRRGQDQEAWPDWASWQYPTEANPFIPAAFIEQKRRDMPEADFRQEYLAEFLDAEAHPIGLEHIRACVGPLSTAEPAVWGVDLARSVDFTVAVALDAGGHVCRLERWKSDWGVTRARLNAILGQTVTYADSTGVGDPIVEDLQRDGRRVVATVFTARVKQQLVEGLIAGIQQRRVRFPDGWLRAELESLTAERLATGTRYTAPDGLHDDGVMALALAWSGLPSFVAPQKSPLDTVKVQDRAPSYDYEKKRFSRVTVEDALRQEVARGQPKQRFVHRVPRWTR